MTESASSVLMAQAALVGDPDAAAASRARLRLDEAGLLRAAGRLGVLAAWWAGARGDDRAPAPERVLVLGGTPATGVDEAIVWGIEQVNESVDSGTELLLVTLPDRTDAPRGPVERIAVAALLPLDPIEAAEWPMTREMDDEDWTREVIALRDGLHDLGTHLGRDLTRGVGGTIVAQDVEPLLHELADPALAAGTAAALTAAVRRTPVLLDGAGATAAALLARRIGYSANQWWQSAQCGQGGPFDKAVASMHLEPLLNLGASLQDGSGARIAQVMLREAAALLRR